MARAETGPMQFGDDWPGVFIRGDDAFGYSMALWHAITKLEQGDGIDQLNASQLRDLHSAFGTSIVGNKVFRDHDVQRMKPITEARAEQRKDA